MRTVYIKRTVSRVLSSSSLHATSCILLGISTSSLFSLFSQFPQFPQFLSLGNARPVPPISVQCLHLTLSIAVRQVRVTLFISLSDMSILHCPSLCPTRSSDTVRLSVQHVCSMLSVTVDTSVRRCLRPHWKRPFPFPFPFPFLLHSHSRLYHTNSLEYLGELLPLHYSTLTPAARLLPLLLATFIRTACLPSTSSTSMGTRGSTTSLRTAVLHSYMLRVCRHCRWLHPNKLLICCQHHQPAWVRGEESRRSVWLSYTPTCYMYAAIAAGYIHTGCSSAVYIVNLRSLAALLWYPLLSYIRTRCSYAINIVALHSHALRSLIGAHCSSTFVPAARLPPLPLATFIYAARMPSTSSTCIRMRFRASLVPIAVQHSYMLHIWYHYCWLHSYVLLVCPLHCRPVFVHVVELRC